MAVDIDNPKRLHRAAVIGADGTKLGTVSAVYFDNTTDRPACVAVRTGLFGLNVALVPLAAAQLRDGELHVPYDREQLRSAPHHDPGLELSPQDEIDLFGHYGLAYGDTPAAPVSPGPAGTGPSSATDAMTRSEERLRVRTESQPTERVRLRKYLVTSYQQVTVPVRREQVRLEHAPPDPEVDDTSVDRRAVARPSEADAPVRAPSAGGPEGPDEHVITLHEERPVVRTETVPVERVRLGKETVTEHRTVGGEVRREEIEVDTDPDVR